MIAVRNPHAVSRLAHRQLSVGVAEHEPDHLLDAPPALTAEEQAADALVSLENRDRYLAQSEATVVGAPAPIPPRPSLRLVSASPAAPATPPPLARGAAGLAPSTTDKEHHRD